ncbi:hypothetical protein V2J09_020905 [Rumex salicifolius]
MATTFIRVLVPFFLLILILMGYGTADRAHEVRLCTKVVREFAPCVIYLSGRTPEADPPDACCSGIRRLNNLTKSHKYAPSRFCQCIEDLYYVMKIEMEVTRIQSIEPGCDLHLSFPISVSMNCSEVK